ncbi:unnamed protein product [Ceutorhynchus assimilis]|uniref:Uncharacterized protein n=1 Tax=Ceutorhynchus assimilis TaxID=467358 RepID=A0A9N9QP22_9CUCU|nr:unnamed protein product [Ceutorhynchus assimilis]
MPETYNDQHQLILSLLCIGGLIASAIFYAKLGTSNGYLDDINNITETPDNLTQNAGSNATNSTKVKLAIKPQPACPPQDKFLELSALCDEVLVAKFSCTPEDIMNPAKHKIPKFYYQQQSVKNNSSNETQNTIVNYIIAALLITSLGAALLEFYRAKISPTPSVDKRGSKTLLNRKCSLADLTVLKHHRKELVRRESILESQFEEGDSTQNHFQGSKPFPLLRRCSFPVSLPSDGASVQGGFAGSLARRKLSIAEGGRRLSIVNDGGSRKLSIVNDESILWRRGSLVGGEDSSPERKVHHSRLVHRH